MILEEETFQVHERGAEFTDHLKLMRDWHASTGGILTKVEMYEIEPGNNEMRASEDIKEGDLLAFIPEEMLLTVKHARENSPNVQILREKDLLD